MQVQARFYRDAGYSSGWYHVFLSPSHQFEPEDPAAQPDSPARMRFIFTGFRQDGGSRIFSYEALGEGGVRTRFTVRVDLELSRRYRIRLQELPLFCVSMLERRVIDERDLVFTEEAMSRAVGEAAAAQEAEAAKAAPPKRRAKKEPDNYDPYEGTPMPPPKNGSGW